MRSFKNIVVLAFLFISNLVIGQKPREIDLDNDPVDWTDPAKIIVLIVIPVLMLIVGIALRMRYKKKKQLED